MSVYSASTGVLETLLAVTVPEGRAIRCQIVDGMALRPTVLSAGVADSTVIIGFYMEVGMVSDGSILHYLWATFCQGV